MFLFALLGLFLFGVFTEIHQTLAAGSLIATTSSSDATSGSRNLKLFIASGRFWAVFSDGANMVYSSSIDGASWTSPTVIRTGVLHGSWFGIYFNGTHFAYAVAFGTPIFYRLGVPLSNGIISWVAPEQSFATGNAPAISFDSNGYVWIGFSFNGNPWIIRDANRDGTWANDTSSPFNGTAIQLTGVAGSWSTFPQPMTSGKMYLFYGLTSNGLNGNGIKGHLITPGSPVPPEEVVTSDALPFGETYSSVSYQDNVFVVYKKATGDVAYERRPSGGPWSSELVIQSGNVNTSYPALALNTSSNSLAAFWANAPTNNILYYRRCIGLPSCTWDANPTILQDETADGNVVLPSAYWQDGVINGVHYLALEYETNSTTLNTFKVKFASVSWPTPQPSPPQNLHATAGIRNNTLSWLSPAVGGRAPITNYRIYRGFTSGGENATALTQIANLTSYIDTSVTGGLTYYYKVTAVNSLGESGYSYEASATPNSQPQPPTNLQAVPAQEKATLTWSAPTNNGNSTITGYRIYRGQQGGTLYPLYTTKQTSYIDYYLNNGETYTYKVTALNRYGESAPSFVNVTPGAGVNALPPLPFALILITVLTIQTAARRTHAQPIARNRE